MTDDARQADPKDAARCPACGRSKLIEGQVVSASETTSLVFVPPGARLIRWMSGVPLPNVFQYCLECGHLASRLAPEAVRTFLREYGTPLATEHLDALIAGPEHDVPDVPEARAAARGVAEINALIVDNRQPEATRRYRDLTGTTWDQAIDAIRHWRERTRPERLAMLGWMPVDKTPPEPSDAGQHPLHDPELDG
jgi:hypothetical protein